MSEYTDRASDEAHVERPMLAQPQIGLTCTIQVLPTKGGFISSYTIVLVDPSTRIIGHQLPETWATATEAWHKAMVEVKTKLARLWIDPS
jgi:hypothetical protein